MMLGSKFHKKKKKKTVLVGFGSGMEGSVIITTRVC